MAGPRNLEKYINIEILIRFMKGVFIASFIFIVLILAACTPKPKETPASNVVPTNEAPSTQKPSQEIHADVADMISKYKTKVQSIKYNYRGPETGNNFYESYVKGNRIKYLPARALRSLDIPDSYDTILIDKIGLTAKSYCLAAYCKYPGKKADLDFDKYYILTPLDWISDLKKAKKVGEEIIDDRNTWKIETEKGLLWVDTFFGIPLKVESNGKTYKYEQIAANIVTDSDLVPSS